MNRLTAGLIGLGLLLGGLVVMSGLDSCRRGRGAAAEGQAQVHVQEAQQHVGAAQTHDQAVADLKDRLQEAQLEVDRLKEEAGRLRGRLASRQGAGVGPAPDPAPAVPAPGAPADDHPALIAKLDQVIQAQGLQIGLLKAQAVELGAARDEWKSAFENERRARLAQEAATEAWKRAVSTSKWRGRAEGFVVGLALGWAGGKL